VLGAHLRLIGGEADVPLHWRWKLGQHAVRVGNKDQSFHAGLSY
jgi:hypothetical protein